MIGEKMKTIEREAEFLDETFTLRGWLASAKREHTELLEHREEALREGRDLLPRIGEVFLEIESLPVEIAKLQGRIHWLINQGIEKLNIENSRAAGQQYIKSRDNLRQALETLHGGLVSVEADIRAGGELGSSLTDGVNSKLVEIEEVLGGVHFSRATYRVLPLPMIDIAAVARGELLGAIDRWIAGLR